LIVKSWTLVSIVDFLKIQTFSNCCLLGWLPGSIPCDTSQATRDARVFGFARAGPRNGENRALACGGSAKLFGVQIVNPEFGHGPSRICAAARDVQPLREGLK
jgi:hypothetical protein